MGNLLSRERCRPEGLVLVLSESRILGEEVEQRFILLPRRFARFGTTFMAGVLFGTGTFASSAEMYEINAAKPVINDESFAPQDRGCGVEYTCLTISAGCSGVELNGRCISDPTPAQRAEYDRVVAENRRQVEAERLARFEAREARLRAVDAETVRLGAHRRAEAERLVQMREAAEEARRGAAETARLAAMTPLQRRAYQECRRMAQSPTATVSCQ